MKRDTRPLTRQQISEFIPNSRSVIAYEALQGDVSTAATILSTAPFITTEADSNLGQERVLTGSANVTVVDGGAGGNVVLDLTDTPIVNGAYGSATQTVSYTVDAKGRLIAGASFTLITTNITEGAKLFYTDTRARNALSAGGGISYTAGTGVIALAAIPGVAGTYASPTSITVNGFGQITAIS